MTHTYTVSGMTCSGCEAKVKQLLTQVEGVKEVAVDLAKGAVTIGMGRHVPTVHLQAALRDYPKYQLKEEMVAMGHEKEERSNDGALISEPRSWLATYKPILLVFGYILLASLLAEVATGRFLGMRWMGHFMAGFFLVFSFFKMLDIPAFADSYGSYDIVASRWRGWGILYPFVELGLGILYLVGYNPAITNGVTLVVMVVSIIGVLRSVLSKKSIQCACLGAVFNLPMSTVTIVEDGVMIAMAAYSLLMLSIQ